MESQTECNILMNMLSPPADVKFYDELGRSLKPTIVKGIIDLWANWTNLAT